MTNKIPLTFIILIIVNFFLISSTNAQETTPNENKISQIMETNIFNPALKIIGIKEALTLKELIICICLIVISIAVIWGTANFAEIINGFGVNFLISAIIVLIAGQSGIFIKITKEITTIPEAMKYITTNKITIIIIILILITLIPLSKFLKKTIKKTKEQEREEGMIKRKNKVEMLTKIKDYETDTELKTYGIKDPNSL